MSSSSSTRAHSFILVVEDNSFQCMVCVNTIKNVFQEADVQSAAKMGEAWDLLEKCAADQKKLPDLILSDVYLGEPGPGTDGPDLLKKLKEDARFKHIPVVMYSAAMDDEKKLELLSAGADAIVDKPLKKEEIEGWAKYFG